MSGKDEIRTFVQELLTRQDDRRPLTDGDSLLMSGRLQSIDAVEIVLFLEERFGIDFAEIGFDREQLDSIDAIAALTQTTAARS
ncbi:MAG: acyl carrier protein [Acidobacteriaceae bacterium]